MRIQSAVLLVAVSLLVAVPSFSRGDELPEGWFEFPMSGLDASLPDVDLSSLDDGPAGSGGFVRNVDGHFVDESGTRLRFLGTNVCFAAAFPQKSEAPRLAARMAKLGINVVRFHHIDNAASPRGIWMADQKGLDPQQLDRLDWFIAKLAEQGVYINLNLHVSRSYRGMNRNLERAFRYGKALDNFYRPYIEMQKDYARALLAHHNPYTGRTYTDDPAVLCVEINNENSLTTTDWNDLADLPDPWGADLRGQWNAWLKQHYASMEELRKAWREIDEPLGTEMLHNTDLASGTKAWNLEAPKPAKATLRVVSEGPSPGMKSLRAELTQPGTESWHFQTNQTGVTLKSEKPYTFTFWAKSDRPRSIRVDARLAKSPWSHLGLNRSIELTPEWRQFTIPFQASGGQKDSCRVGWGFGNDRGSVWLSGMSLKPGGVIGTPRGESLEQENIGLTHSHDSSARQTDYQRFLMETEQQYHAEMMQLLKQDLGLRSIVTNTQASYGGLAGVLREGSLSDFIDMHGYWQHPRFPGRPWDPRNWTIPNTSMIGENDGGVLARIAQHRVQGKPFTVSEYNHPTPNDHCVEMFPMLASFAAFQNWDGIYQFTYSHTSEDFQRPRINSYFDLVNHPGQLVWLPIAATIFRTAAVEPDANPIILKLPNADTVVDVRRSMSYVWSSAGAPLGLPVTRAVGVQLESDHTPTLSELVTVPEDRRVSSTGQITWQLPGGEPRSGMFLVDSPRVRCAVGYLQDERIQLDDVSFALKQASNGWAALGLAALDHQPVSRSKKMLLVAVGQIANTGMVWNEDRTSIGDKWGREPTIAEGIGAVVRMPGNVSVRALTPGGKAGQSVPVSGDNGDSRFEIGAPYQTLWYLITRD